ncbi:Flavone 3'-O-methyltransferase 1, partial [Bienertia sinuspersici]
MVHGMHAFEYLSVDPRFNEVFNKLMAQSVIFVKIISNKYKGLESYNVKKLVDVGGGLGHSIGFITSQYPSIKGINFDLPHVIKDAPPTPGDFIFIKWILHDWSDKHCLTLLKNCYKTLPEDGKIIVVVAITKEEIETLTFARAISLADFTMMTQSQEAKRGARESLRPLLKLLDFRALTSLGVCIAFGLWNST